MQTLEIGKSIAALCREHKFLEAVEQHYAADVVSVEGAGAPGMEQRMEGIDAIRGKNQWWVANHELHAMDVEGPFCSEGSSQFAMRYGIDVTNKASGERTKMTEVALYTVENGKIVEERFFYAMG